MNTPVLLRVLPAVALLALPFACGGGDGGGDTTTAASATQVAQAVLVATASISGVSAASDTSTGSVTQSSVRGASVRAAAMGGGMMGGHFTGMDSGPGSLDLDPTTCDGTGSGTVEAHMKWTDLQPDTTNPDTPCLENLDTTLHFDNCGLSADQSMHGTMGMTIAGTTCDPTAIAMDFSGVTIATPDGTLTGDFTMGMANMTFTGDPANLGITDGTMTIDGTMQMAGSDFPAVDMTMDNLAFHFDDTANTGDLNGALTVRCNGRAYPMTMATDPDGLTLDADGNVIGGQMTVTAEGIAHQVTFNSDGSVDVTPAGGTMVHLAEPAASEFCAL